MAENDALAEQFESERARLQAVAYRMLGSPSEADDAVQEAWIRLSRTGGERVDNLGGWLTTVVARVCLDMLRARKTRPQEPLDPADLETRASDERGTDPQYEVELADSMGLALLVVLETLSPAERVAFVLHDMFDLPFDEIGSIVGREPAAARQLASRARRRIQGAEKHIDADVSHHRPVVEAFLRASREGDFAGLLELLAPDVVLRADAVSVETARANIARGMAAPVLEAEVRGRREVADAFGGRARAAQLAMLGGAFGAVWAPGGVPRFGFTFQVREGKITEIGIVGDAAHLAALKPEIVDDQATGLFSHGG